VRVIAAGLADDNIDRLIKQTQQEIEPLTRSEWIQIFFKEVTSAVRIVPNEQRLVLASLDRAQARVVPTRSGQRQQLSLGWEGRKPLDTE
jgi:hypothetical protein